MKRIGILGAATNVGKSLVMKLKEEELNINLYQHKSILDYEENRISIFTDLSSFLKESEYVISLIPIWYLKDLLKENKKFINFKKLIALSSTSASTKFNSQDNWERKYALRFLDSEEEIQKVCKKRNINCLILRPSMIWGNSMDLNISFIMKFISKYGFLLLPAEGKGLRYPIHINQLSDSIIRVVFSENEGLFNVLGPEELTYKDMCLRIFEWYSFYPLVIIIPKTLRRIFLILSTYILKKPYINYSSLERINYSPNMAYQNPKTIYANGKFTPFKKNDLEKVSIAAFSFQFILKKISKFLGII